MGARQRDWLRHKLGDECAYCGRTEKLQFDVCISVDSGRHHRRMDWSHRMSFYTGQLAAGNLQLLCDVCNGRKGANPF